MKKVTSILIASVLVLSTAFTLVGCKKDLYTDVGPKNAIGDPGDEIASISYETNTDIEIVFQYLEEGGYEISEDEKYMINEKSSLSPVVGKDIIVHPYIGTLNPEVEGETLNDYRAKLVESGVDEALLPETMIFGRYGFYDKQSEEEYVLYLEYFDAGEPQYASFTFKTINENHPLADVFESKDVQVFVSGILLVSDAEVSEQ